MKEKRHIAIIGGAFDPPHNGHFNLAKWLLDSDFKIDEVWFVPSPDSRYDKKSHASAADRAAMVEKGVEELFQNSSKVKVHRGQLAEPFSDGAMVNFVQHLIQESKGRGKFSLVIGSDVIPQLTDWVEYKQLFQLVDFITFARPGSSLSEVPDGARMAIVSDYVPLDLSSSELRAKISSKQSIFPLAPASVLLYIDSSNLYQTQYFEESKDS